MYLTSSIRYKCDLIMVMEMPFTIDMIHACRMLSREDSNICSALQPLLSLVRGEVPVGKISTMNWIESLYDRW